MNDSLNHRGNDYSKTWNNSSVGLGCQMFYTTPESFSEKLPLEDSEKNCIKLMHAQSLHSIFNM